MTNAWSPGNHAVQFYENEPFIHHTIADFFSQTPQPGDALILVSRSRTFEAVTEHLNSGNYGRRRDDGDNLHFIDAEVVLSEIVQGQTLDMERAETLFSDALSRVGASHPHGAVRLYGEIVDILCERGRHATALEFEALANVLLDLKPRLSILCSYAMERFRADPEAAEFGTVCRKHSHVLPAESFSSALRVQYRQSAMLRRDALAPTLEPQAQLSMAGPEDTAVTLVQQIYVIDDDASIRRSLSRLLNSSDGEVKTFESAEAFLADLDTLPRGCVIADVQLPGISGLDLVDRMSRTHASWPVILMSGMQDEEVQRGALRRGARVFLSKPFNSQGLFEAIARALA